MSAPELVLHVGINSDDIGRARAAAQDHTAPMTVDGDGWEAWGEAPGTDLNDDGTVHVQILVSPRPGARRAEKIVETLHKHDLLVPMRADYQRGVVAALTGPTDWSDVAHIWLVDDLPGRGHR